MSHIIPAINIHGLGTTHAHTCDSKEREKEMWNIIIWTVLVDKEIFE